MLRLGAGPLAMTLRDGGLWHLGVGDREVWHAVTFPYRDTDWWTPPVCDATVTRRSRDGGFAVDVEGGFATEPHIRTHLNIVGNSDGSLTVAAEAVPSGDILTNRLGLCLLYGIALAGTPCEIEHDHGRVSRSTFPTLVPPWPPFMQIRAIRHAYAPGCWATCTFGGDVFEFEDQRNNADASFKVYSRSNMMPRPYLLRAGVAVRQSLVLRLETGPAPGRSRPPARIARSVVSRPLPGFGLALRVRSDAAAIRAAAARIKPRFFHLALGRGDAVADWARLLPGLRDAAVPLRLDLALGEEAGRAAFVDDVRDAFAGAVEPESIAAYPSDDASIATVRRRFRGVPVGGGTPHFFAQMNRLEGLGRVDFLSFTLSPLVHGADDASVMLSPDSISGQIATLSHRYPGLPVRIGPSAIAMRASPLGRQPRTDGTRRIAMAADDPRARGLFGAAWVTAVAARCTDACVDAVTLMAVDGPSGIMSGTAAETIWHPASAVLARLGGPAEALAPPVAPVSQLAALAFRRGALSEILLANLSAAPIEVDLRDWAAGAILGMLDEEALRTAGPGSGPPLFVRRSPTSRLVLGAYAVASLVAGADPSTGAGSS